jgi:hypothetical protein
MGTSDEKTSFSYRTESSQNTRDNFVNYLEDADILNGFLFIFDPKHEANNDPKKFINQKRKGNSFVEIQFWRSNEITSQSFDWVRNLFYSFFQS